MPLGTRSRLLRRRGRYPPWMHPLSRVPLPWPRRVDPAPEEQLWQALLFPARGDCLPFQRREYSFYCQPPKNLLRCEIEKASPMAGLWGYPLLSC